MRKQEVIRIGTAKDEKNFDKRIAKLEFEILTRNSAPVSHKSLIGLSGDLNFAYCGHLLLKNKWAGSDIMKQVTHSSYNNATSYSYDTTENLDISAFIPQSFRNEALAIYAAFAYSIYVKLAKTQYSTSFSALLSWASSLSDAPSEGIDGASSIRPALNTVSGDYTNSWSQGGGDVAPIPILRSGTTPYIRIRTQLAISNMTNATDGVTINRYIVGQLSIKGFFI